MQIGLRLWRLPFPQAGVLDRGIQATVLTKDTSHSVGNLPRQLLQPAELGELQGGLVGDEE
jgi:hypothetical protein